MIIVILHYDYCLDILDWNS